MKKSARLAGGLAAIAATGLFAGTSAAATPQHATPHSAGNVFVQTDNTSGNSVVVYDRAADGTLRQAGSYATGGLGGVLSGSAVDHLGSQGSLTYDRAAGLLYAVNPGSNTVTVFAVEGDRLVRREVLGSGGNFPVSVTVHGNVVYVLNARDGGSVQGFLRLGSTLIRIPAWHRALGLDASETPEFTSTPGQVAFTPDGSKLIVTTKNNGDSIDVFDVDFAGGISARPVVTSDPGAVPFAVTFDPRGHVVVAEGANALATFTLNRNNTLTLVDRVATGQSATCWVSADGSTLYTSNAGSGTLSRFQDGGSGQLTAQGNTATDPGTVDATVSSDGHELFAQTGANGVVDEFRVNANGSLTELGSVTVPGSVGGEGIAAS
jgi:6-phosphogluconolactonase (cycloisomerase 2 family)